MRLLAILSVGVGLIVTCGAILGCGSDDDGDSGSSDPAIPTMSIQCSSSDNPACTTALDARDVRAAIFTGACADFGSSTDILSLGTGLTSCESDRCETVEGGYIDEWTNGTLPAGDYNVFIFIDEDSNQVPSSNEPSTCESLTLPTSDRPNYSDFAAS